MIKFVGPFQYPRLWHGSMMHPKNIWFWVDVVRGSGRFCCKLSGYCNKMAHFHHVWLVVAPVLKNISPISGDGKQCSNTQNHQSDVNHLCLLVQYPLHRTFAINELLFHKTVPPAELVRKLHRIEQGTPETSEAKVAPSDEGKIHSWIHIYIMERKKKHKNMFPLSYRPSVPVSDSIQ